MRLLTLSSLLATGLLAFAGCAGGDEPTGKEDPATSISQLPLSPACSACAQTAMAQSCSAELKACANNPSCFDVESCLQACDPSDIKCFGQCAEASAAFDDLTTCVFCDSCPKECTGEWQCGGGSSSSGGGSQCDKTGDCAACATCASQNDCAKQMQECEASPDCAQAVQCVTSCGSDPQCLEKCGIKDASQIPQLESLVSCVVCDVCPSDCANQPVACPQQPPPDQCDATKDCSACAQCAIQSACTSEYEVCMKSADCSQIAECTVSCGQDPDCVEKCAQSFPNGAMEFQPLAECVICKSCSSACDGQAWGCPP